MQKIRAVLEQMGRKKYVLFILIPVLLELFVFNYRFWTTHLFYGYEEIAYNYEQVYAHWGLEFYEGLENSFIVTDPEKCHFEIQDISMPIYSVYMDLARVAILEEGQSESIACEVWVKDEGNVLYYQLPYYELVPSIEQTQWIYPQAYGNVKAFKLKLTGLSEGDIIQYHEIRLNSPTGMRFSCWRVLFLSVMGIFVWIFRGRSRFYRLKYSEVPAACNHMITIGCVLLTALLFWGVEWQASHYCKMEEQTTQYRDLTAALAKGQFYMEEEPPQWLIEMENPYDTGARERICKEDDTSYQWDYAYYNGKYYIYFGIVPSLIFYLPYYLITGRYISNVTVVFLTCLLSVLGIGRLLQTVFKKWFSDVPCLHYILCLLVCMNSYGGVWLLARPEIYEVCISTGVMLAIWSIALWMEAVHAGEIQSYSKLAAGSFLAALITGCRPPVFAIFIIGCFLVWIPLLKKERLHQKIKFLIAFFAPFIPVALGMMYYNYMRFGSVFDFGANYNLTNNDMTKRGFRLGRAGNCIFEYIFRPLHIRATFPYIQKQEVISSYMGRVVADLRLGGVLMVTPFLIPGVMYLSGKFAGRNKETGLLARLCLCLAVGLTIIEGNVAGVYNRYHTDFVFLLMIVAVFAICELERILGTVHAEVLYAFRTTMMFTVVASIFISYLSIFLRFDYHITSYMTKLYYTLLHFIEFWH